MFKGTSEEVNQFFYEKLWTDGLPIVPPTINKVEEFLKYTDRPPDEVISVLLPGKREATVWKVAVNGVMAGCRPEYMPVLLSMVEAVADPRFGIQHRGSTHGHALMIILNGPIVKQLDFNYTAGVTRPGKQANTTVARFLDLFMRNVPRYVVGVTDMATFGRNFIPVLAENEDVCAQIGWKPLSAYRGFKAGDNVVTVTALGDMSAHIAGMGVGVKGQLASIAQQVRNNPSGITFGPEVSPVIALSPVIASSLAKAGYSKDSLAQWLFDNARVPNPDACEQVKPGPKQLLPVEVFCPDPANPDPNRLLPLVHNSREFLIVVSGDVNRNRGFVTGQVGEQGLATSKEVKLPANWDKLMAELRK